MGQPNEDVKKWGVRASQQAVEQVGWAEVGWALPTKSQVDGVKRFLVGSAHPTSTEEAGHFAPECSDYRPVFRLRLVFRSG